LYAVHCELTVIDMLCVQVVDAKQLQQLNDSLIFVVNSDSDVNISKAAI